MPLYNTSILGYHRECCIELLFMCVVFYISCRERKEKLTDIKGNIRDIVVVCMCTPYWSIIS